MEQRYKFLRLIDDEIRSNQGPCAWTVGEWQESRNAPELCHHGFHCSEKIFDALGYVRGEVVALVEVDGKSVKSDDKETWSKMRLVKAWKWQKQDSVKLAIFAAELVIEHYEKLYPDDKRPRKAMEAAKNYLKNPSADAADAADAAAYAAADAADAANAAADAAAYAAARAAANAAYAAADAAADAAARAADAANAAADAAYAAANAAAYAAARAADAAYAAANAAADAAARAAYAAARAAARAAYAAARAAARAADAAARAADAAVIDKIEAWMQEHLAMLEEYVPLAVVEK